MCLRLRAWCSVLIVLRLFPNHWYTVRGLVIMRRPKLRHGSPLPGVPGACMLHGARGASVRGA